MKRKFNPKFFHTLFFRIYLYFAIVLTVFATLIGFIFMELYKKNTTASYRKQLENQGYQIARKVSWLVLDDNIETYNNYLEVLEGMQSSETGDKREKTDTWIISNPKAAKPMSKEFENVDLEGIELTEEVKEVLNSAFDNQVSCIQSYEETYEMVMLRVATPILDARGNVIGAVLLNAYVQSQKNVIRSSRSLIINSIFAALLISFILSFLFARQISRPISRICMTTVKLADGEYERKTEIYKKDEIGELANAIDILSDQLKKNEVERKNMEQMRLDFFANVSHELRTPITVMRGYTETLADGIVTQPEKITQYYNRMLLECKSMERLVGDLLLLSKIQNPDFVIDAEPVNIIQVFDDIMRSAKVIGDKKDITLHFEKDSESCMMMGDYDRLRQTFMVILDNAVKFSDYGGSIFIKINSKDKIEITIKDQGIGISEEELPYIFEKFYKSRLRQNAQGSGLGLVIAKQIVNRHGGDIEALSKVNEGTTFIITFDKMVYQEEIT